MSSHAAIPILLMHERDPPVWTTEDELCSLSLLSRRESTCSIFRTTYSDLFLKDANKIERH